MLDPFMIRGLHASSSRGSGDGAPDPTGRLSGELPACQPAGELQTRPRGIVRLSAPEYDDIATNHPRARLTYIDEDDGELITVGSSLELSQRLNEPTNWPSQLYTTQQPANSSQVGGSEMHLFDIRRSNSVTELWKKIECPSYPTSTQDAEVHDQKAEDAPPSHEGEGVSSSGPFSTYPVEGGGPQAFLTAFEAQLAMLLGKQPPQSGSQPRSQPSSQPGTQPGSSSFAAALSRALSSANQRNPGDTVDQVFRNIRDGYQMLNDEIRPTVEHERQFRLSDAQRAVPWHVGTTVQVAFEKIVASLRYLAGNHDMPASGDQHSGSNPPAQPSIATDAIDRLRTMASNFDQVGQTLFPAFENEHRRDQPRGSSQAPGEGIPALSNTGNREQADTADMAVPDAAVNLSGAGNGSSGNEKETLTSGDTGDAKPNTQSNGVVGQRNAASTGDNENRYPIQPSRHCPVPPPSFVPCRDEKPESSALNTSQHPPVSNPSRYPLFPYMRPSTYYPPPPPPPLPAAPLCQTPSLPPPSFIPQPHHARAAPRPPVWCTNQPDWHFPAPSRPHAQGLQAGSSPHSSGRDITSARITGHPSQGLSESPIRRFESKTLFIGNVGFNVSPSMIQTVFASKGFLVDVDLPLDSRAGKHAGFGYLKFSSVHATKAALEALQGTLIDGHSINLEISDSSPITTSHTTLESRGTFSQAKTDKSENTPNAQARRSSNSHNPREPFGQLKAPCSTEQGNKGKERASGGNGKSLAFSEPNSSSSQASSKAGLGVPDSMNGSHKPTSGNGALLDQDNGDSEFSTRYPSLLPDRSTRRPRFGDTPDPLVHLSPELEMRRFPPVSQLDAHAMANERGERPTAMSSLRDTHQGGKKDIESRRVTSPTVPGSFPQDPQNLPEMEEESKQNLRRSNTVMPVNPSARLAGPFKPLFPVDSDNAAKPLRRRATEHQSFQGKDREGRQPASQWGRPTNKTDQSIHPSRRSGYQHHEPPANRHHMAHTQVSQTSPPASIDNAKNGAGMGCRQIDDCVATLLRLGYGGVRDGGHARIRMYSEVANGKVLEAIEMIEEERKAYEQQIPQR